MRLDYLNGVAGPGEVERALSADFVVAHPDAVLRLREQARFVSPALLSRRGARRIAFRIALVPDVPAREAFDEGWIDALAESELEAKMIAGDPARSAAARAAVRRLLDVPSKAAALALERAEFALCLSAEEKREGIAAFFERRAPRFENP